MADENLNTTIHIQNAEVLAGSEGPVAGRRYDLDQMIAIYDLLSSHGDPVKIAEELGELIEAAGQLVELMRSDGENSVEHFERIAAMFYADTGIMTPGKDSGAVISRSQEERIAAYDEWCRQPQERLRAALKAIRV